MVSKECLCSDGKFDNPSLCISSAVFNVFHVVCKSVRKLVHAAYRVLRSVYTERERDRDRERGFSSRNSLVICRRTVQIKCEREREHFFVRANGRFDCPQSEFCQKFARLFAFNQSEST